jgi:hypothetical protein
VFMTTIHIVTWGPCTLTVPLANNAAAVNMQGSHIPVKDVTWTQMERQKRMEVWKLMEQRKYQHRRQ